MAKSGLQILRQKNLVDTINSSKSPDDALNAFLKEVNNAFSRSNSTLNKVVVDQLLTLKSATKSGHLQVEKGKALINIERALRKRDSAKSKGSILGKTKDKLKSFIPTPQDILNSVTYASPILGGAAEVIGDTISKSKSKRTEASEGSDSLLKSVDSKTISKSNKIQPDLNKISPKLNKLHPDLKGINKNEDSNNQESETIVILKSIDENIKLLSKNSNTSTNNQNNSVKTTLGNISTSNKSSNIEQSYQNTSNNKSFISSSNVVDINKNSNKTNNKNSNRSSIANTTNTENSTEILGDVNSNIEQQTSNNTTALNEVGGSIFALSTMIDKGAEKQQGTSLKDREAARESVQEPNTSNSLNSSDIEQEKTEGISALEIAAGNTMAGVAAKGVSLIKGVGKGALRILGPVGLIAVGVMAVMDGIHDAADDDMIKDKLGVTQVTVADRIGVGIIGFMGSVVGLVDSALGFLGIDSDLEQSFKDIGYQGLVKGRELMLSLFETVFGFFDTVGVDISNTISNIGGAIKTGFLAIFNLPMTMLNGITDFIVDSIENGFIETIKERINTIQETISSIFKFVQDAIDSIKNFGSNIVDGVSDTFSSGFDFIKDSISSVTGSEKVKTFNDDVRKLTGLEPTFKAKGEEVDIRKAINKKLQDASVEKEITKTANNTIIAPSKTTTNNTNKTTNNMPRRLSRNEEVSMLSNQRNNLVT